MDWLTQRPYIQAKVALGWWVTRYLLYMGYFSTELSTWTRGLWCIKNSVKEMA